MIQQREGLSLFTANDHHNDNSNDTDGGRGDQRKNKCRCCCRAAAAAAAASDDNDESAARKEIPLEILSDHIAPFLDRKTYNSCLLLCHKARQTLMASWWKRRRPSTSQNMRHGHGHGYRHQMLPPLPPWPRKLVSRDPSCRVRCLTFSEDNALLACGCSDGNIRSWDVRLGELPMSGDGNVNSNSNSNINGESHWPDEAVVALAYSHCSDGDVDRRLLASSSTDGTIRIWKMIRSGIRIRDRIEAQTQIVATKANAAATILTTPKRQKTSVGRDDEDGIAIAVVNPSSVAVALACIMCIPADHAVSLHFSPDDSYLVSGHLRTRTAGDLNLAPASTIEIRDVRTGLRLHSLEGGGVPVGFVPSPMLYSPTQEQHQHQQQHHRHHRDRDRQREHQRYHESSSREDPVESTTEVEEYRLITTCGPNACLKMWSWNRTRCVTTDEEHFNESENLIENENHDPNIPNYHPRSNHSSIDENSEQLFPIPIPDPVNYNSDGRIRRGHKKTVLDGGRCIQQWSLDRFNTVLPVRATIADATTATTIRTSDKPEAIKTKTETIGPKHKKTTRSDSEDACDILVAAINEPSKDSFAVWRTSSPQDRRVFRNTNPYEIRFSPDGTKIASVDDFNTVKVWRIFDGVLLKTFSGGDDYEEKRHGGTKSKSNSNNNSSNNSNHCYCDCRIPVNYGDNSIRYEEDEEDSDETSVSCVDNDDDDDDDDDDCNYGYGGNEDGGDLFPIHELVFSKDSSTVAVISRCYNEVHLFST